MAFSVAAFVADIRQSQLLEPAQFEELTRESRSFTDPRSLAKHCLKRNWLTPYQINQILQGQGKSLVLGQYRLLERLGEGGMGQVFKARHQAMGRIVALKLIRKDKLNNENAVKRFRREIAAAAQLTHPNVVLAFDADQVGNSHFIAMEYVEGTDLSRLVREKGVMPVAQACDFIRQVALGLQHAHERGLVHRDIKPSNLLATRGDGIVNGSASNSGVLRRRGKLQVKIMDMGLARIQFESEENTSQVSQAGSVVGTPDFMAPEQAKNSSMVDHRADIYSLGCTFYFLLSGQVPFPGGTNIEKLLKHQMDTVRPIEQVRQGIPESVRLVLRRMMTKRPEERFQTANEVAAKLAPFCDPSAVKQVRTDKITVPLPVAQLAAQRKLAAKERTTSVFSRWRTKTDSSLSRLRQLLGSARRLRGRGPILLLAGVFLLFLIGFFWLLIASLFPKEETTPSNPFGVTRIQPGSTRPRNPGIAIDAQRFAPEDSNVVLTFDVPSLYNSQAFQANSARLLEGTRYWQMLFKELTDLDLYRDVDRVVVAASIYSEDSQGHVILLYGLFDRKRIIKAVQDRNGQYRESEPAEYYAMPNDTFVAMPHNNLVLFSPSEDLLINSLERGQGTGSFRVKDQEVDRFLNLGKNMPDVGVMVGGTTPASDGNNLANMGIRNISLQADVGRNASVKLELTASDYQNAARYQREIHNVLGPYGEVDSPFGAMFKEVLKSTTAVKGTSVIIQRTFSGDQLNSFLR